MPERSGPERSGWLRSASALVCAITAARLIALWFNKTDLFVDESQYWLWGQRLDFGYYSKPPLIAWVIRAVTEMASSDSPFWVRAPGAVFHGATALILGALAARLYSASAGLWVAVSYATLPMVALGSLLMSTDTIMAPFFAAALLSYFELTKTGSGRYAILTGAMIGLAFMAKYAALYFFVGAALGVAFVPQMRIPLRQASLLATTFLLIISPNILWNLSHDLTTVEHTMDNVGWVRGPSFLSSLNPAGLGEFLASQLAVFGPVLFVALIWGYVRPAAHSGRALLAFSLPVLLIVSAQAVLSQAYANWAVATYFAGTVIAVPLLLQNAPRLLALSLVINGAVSILLPVLALIAPLPEWRGKPLLSRYLGRADLSHQIILAAKRAGTDAVVAVHRDILADLFLTGKDAGLSFFAPQPTARPANYYQQNFPMSERSLPTLYVLTAPPLCNGVPLERFATLRTKGGAYDGHDIAVYLILGDCVNDPR